MALRVLYGAIFVLVLPALLVAWAVATADIIRLPMPGPPLLGIIFAVPGALLIVSGMSALWRHGGGLPMNAFPPPRFVRGGVYRLLPHPIYAGFSMLCAGISIAAGSPSGLWLVTPVVVLSCAALVLGYERHDLELRFGARLRILPAPKPEKPSAADRMTAYLVVLIPWLIAYEAIAALGVPRDAIPAYLPFELRLPVIEWTEIFYAGTYVAVCLAPLAAGTRACLRRFEVRALLSMALVFPLYLAVPFTAPPRSFVPHGALGQLLQWERALDTPAAAFPSYHVIWALLAAEVFAGRMPRLRWLWRGWALAVAISCITTGMHAIVDVLAGFLAFALVCRAGSIWQYLRAITERIANSWKEWRFGPVRVINHGAYAGLGTFLALLIVGALVGPGHTPLVVLTAAGGLIGAGVWAQWIEGSPRLLRPYGFYGGVLGVCLAAAMTRHAWLLLAAWAVAGPWVQSMGRLRCLVQGCCHGRPAPHSIGICYVHPRSRVCKLADLAGVPIHPTPLYSILWNVLVAMMIARLWVLHVPLELIAGMYLILSGIGRFVEEAYRGEPQTPILRKLRLYQWLAIASIIIGAVLMAVGPRAMAPSPQLNWASGWAAAAFGVLTTAALGVDFPNSNRRFARLA